MKPRAYRSPKRSADAEETRNKLIAAAFALLTKQTKSGKFSLDAVAKKAGVTRLTVYHQFGSRRALLEAVFDDRAARGGLHRIPEALSDPDTRAGLMRLIAIFCSFWEFNHVTIGRVVAAGAEDRELAESMRQRNERRRKALTALVGRLPQCKSMSEVKIAEIVDVLFALTSFQFFAELHTGDRTAEDICKIIQRLAGELTS